MLLLATLLSLASLTPMYIRAVGVPVWGQCCGIRWTGNTDCVSGTTCVAIDDDLSQCIPNFSLSGGGSRKRSVDVPIVGNWAHQSEWWS
ncbi:hypothetical protein CPC08DRAFT_771604 [Agrocybe pediades]|nr:hypothetical protein CPC08DRAFT_771604 [Agrocybe pediades]